MAQAGYLRSATCTPTTGAYPNSSTSSIPPAHAEFVAAVGRFPLPILPDSDVADRPEHLKKMITRVSGYVTGIIDDARNVPGGLDLRQIKTILSGVASDLTRIIQPVADGMAGRTS
jgi:hypothetical protein